MRLSWKNCALLALVALTPMAALAQGAGDRLLGQATTISEPGNYVLTRDIRLNASRMTGFHIIASGVTLDLNGHEIMGPGGKLGTGVMIEGAQGVKVLNGSMSYLAFGVVVRDSRNVVLRDLCIRGQGLPVASLPPETGIMIAQSRNVVVKDNAIYNTGLGIFVRGGNSWGNRISQNTVTAGTNGVLGICYNPTGTDPNGPRGDLVDDNVVSGFNTGMQFTTNAGYNVIRNNMIAFRTTAIEMLNQTNTVDGNIEVQLP